MPTLERRISIDTMSLLKVILILLVLAFLWLIRDILAILLAALFLAAILRPAAVFFARYRIPRGVTVVVCYLLILGATYLTVSLLLPAIIDQASALPQAFAHAWQSLAGEVTEFKAFTDQYGLTNNVQAGLASIEAQLGVASTGIVGTVKGVLVAVVGFIAVLVMAFYMVVQEDQAKKVFDEFMPANRHALAQSIVTAVAEKMSRWFLGQLALCLIVGLMYYVGLWSIGVDAALVLAIFGGIAEIVPYFGPILSAIPIFIIAAATSPVKALAALIVIIIVQEIEGHVLVPAVMKRAVGLNPLVSIVALLVGAELFGVAGAILSIPFATALAVIVGELYRARKEVF